MKSSYMKQMLSGNRQYRRAFVLAVAVPILCAAAAALVLRVMKELGLDYLPCGIRAVTGFNCLTCGATRATLALMRGDVAGAFWYNPLYTVFLGWVGYLYIRLAISLIKRPYRPYRPKMSRKHAFLMAAMAILFTILRNLPIYQAVFY